MLNVKQESCEYQLLKSFGVTRLKIKPKFTDYAADLKSLDHALIIPIILLIFKLFHKICFRQRKTFEIIIKRS